MNIFIKILIYIYYKMVSYTSSSYTTDFFDLSGVYFNSTTQSSGSSSVD